MGTHTAVSKSQSSAVAAFHKSFLESNKEKEEQGGKQVPGRRWVCSDSLETCVRALQENGQVVQVKSKDILSHRGSVN